MILQPTFGDGEIVSPPYMTPVAIFNDHLPDTDSPPSNSAPATSERYSGVGEYTSETRLPPAKLSGSRVDSLSHHRTQRPCISGREDDTDDDIFAVNSNQNARDKDRKSGPDVVGDDRVLPDDNFQDEKRADVDRRKPVVAKPAHQRIGELVMDSGQTRSGSGTQTPPLNVSTIANALLTASDNASAEDLAAMIIAFSNKERDSHKSKTTKGEKDEGRSRPNGQQAFKDADAEGAKRKAMAKGGEESTRKPDRKLRNTAADALQEKATRSLDASRLKKPSPRDRPEGLKADIRSADDAREKATRSKEDASRLKKGSPKDRPYGLKTDTRSTAPSRKNSSRGQSSSELKPRRSSQQSEIFFDNNGVHDISAIPHEHPDRDMTNDNGADIRPIWGQSEDLKKKDFSSQSDIHDVSLIPHSENKPVGRPATQSSAQTDTMYENQNSSGAKPKIDRSAKVRNPDQEFSTEKRTSKPRR